MTLATQNQLLTIKILWTFLGIFLCSCLCVPVLHADEKQKPAPSKVDIPDKLVPLNPQKNVLLDLKGNRLLLKTKVTFREGILEMLCCLKKTKEHESILVLDAKAYIVHAGLLALNAEPGRPVRYYPEKVASEGPKVDIYLQWKDEKGALQRVPAQKWIRYAVNKYFVEKLDPLPTDLDLKAAEKLEFRYDRFNKEVFWFGQLDDTTEKKLKALSTDKRYHAIIDKFKKESMIREMDTHWIFTGSNISTDDETGQQYYDAQDGCLICVANMPSAMIDVAMESSSSGSENLLFETHTPAIPPLGTEVTIELIPVAPEKTNSAK